MFSIFFLAYSQRGTLRIFALLILAILLVLMVFFEDYQIAALALAFVIVEKFVELVFRKSKKIGFIVFTFIFISTISLMLRELATFNSPYMTLPLGVILFGYFLFIYGVGTSWGGFLRTMLPSLGVLSLAGANVVFYLSITLVLFKCVKLISNQVDRKLDAI
jgi:hypothetical protein